jgi:hypothetical protein
LRHRAKRDWRKRRLEPSYQNELNRTAYRPLPPLPAQSLWIWSWLGTPAQNQERSSWVCAGAPGDGLESLLGNTPNAPKRPVPPPAASPSGTHLHALQLKKAIPGCVWDLPAKIAAGDVRTLSAAAPSADRWQEFGAAAGIAARWAEAPPEELRHNYHSTPGDDHGRAASVRARDIRDSNTAQWNRADMASGLFLSRRWRPSAKRAAGPWNRIQNPETRRDCARHSLVCQENYIQLVGVRFLRGTEEETAVRGGPANLL